MNTHPALSRVRRHGLVGSLPMRHVLAFGLACALSATACADPVNLVRNAAFAEGMAFWVKPAEFGVADPVGAGALGVYRPVRNYTGPVVSQGIHATDIAGKELSLAVDLAQNSTPPGGNSVRVSIEYIRSGGIREKAAVIQPPNSEYAAGGAFATFTGTHLFPADAIKLVGVSIDIVGNGSFKADNLVVTGPVTAGPVPIITSVTPFDAAYQSPVTIRGTDFGSSPGTITVGGSAANLVVDSWTDTRIDCHLLFPNHGGLLRLECYGVIASQSPNLSVKSPHYVLSTPSPTVLAMAGQVVKVDLWLSFFNFYQSTAGIQLGLAGGTGGAVLSPNPILHQGGSRLTLDTTGLSPGSHAYTVHSTDGTVPGNSVPLTLDVRAPGQLGLTVFDPDTFGWLPVTGTLAVTKYDKVKTDYTLLDTGGADITSAGPLEWASSNPAVMRVLPPPNTSEGPALIPIANGACALTATAPNGFVRTIPVTVAITAEVGIIADIGFTDPVMDNSGGLPNLFHATANGGATIISINNFGFVAAEYAYQFGATGSMEFKVPEGQTPGLYEFNAETLTGISRSALLTVTNTPGTGLVSGSVAKSFPYQTLKAGELEFYNAATETLEFSRALDGYGDFRLGFIPPGSYRLRFVPDQEIVPVPLDAPWYPNATTFAEAQTVTVAADGSLADIHFFVFEANVIAPPVEAPEHVNLTRIGNTVLIEVATTAGLRYLLESSETLAEGDWTPHQTINGDGNPITFTDPDATGPGRFYRIKVSR